MDSRVEEFKRIAQERWEYLRYGNASKGNKCYDKMREIYFDLKKDGLLAELATLLTDEDDGVKFEAAQNLLPDFTEGSKRALSEIAPKMGLLAFEAKETLKWWNKKEKSQAEEI